MALNTRGWIKRKLVMTVGNLKTSQNHLDELGPMFQEHLPEIADRLAQIYVALENLQEVIEQLEKNI